MKKTIQIIVLAMLCLKISSRAQTNQPRDITMAGLHIGQKVPDLQLTGISGYKNATAKLTEFKGKLLILDFWATWCSPCVAMIPKLDSLQRRFGDRLQILSVTYQSEKEATDFLNKMEKVKGLHYQLPLVSGDTALHKLFPHIYLPHYVWIDKTGTVLAITGREELSEHNINTYLQTGSLNLNKKIDTRIPYNRKMPLLISGNGGVQGNILQHSLLTAYTEGLGSTIQPHSEKEKLTRMTFLNLPLTRIARHVYGEGKIWIGQNRLIIETTAPNDLTTSLTGSPLTAWYRDHCYCYEILQPANSPVNLWDAMKADLSRYFPQYKIRLEKRKTKCLVLIRTSKTDKLKSKGGKEAATFDSYGAKLQNTSLWQLFARLNVMYLQDSPWPLVNEAAYESPVDMDIQAKLNNVDSLNQALRAYDLELISAERNTDMLIISDSQPHMTTENH